MLKMPLFHLKHLKVDHHFFLEKIHNMKLVTVKIPLIFKNEEFPHLFLFCFRPQK